MSIYTEKVIGSVVQSQVVSDFCDPTDCSLLGSSVHGVSQARERVAISFFWESSWPRDPTQISCIAGRLYRWDTEEARLDQILV